MDTPLLDKIKSPQDLKKMDFRELELLCVEIRNFLIENVSKTGGHLSSNLGVIELTVAMHRVFNSPQDMFVFDVGHQCYTHKLLTGRREGFAQLRQAGGLSGFPNPNESEHDIFLAGHGSTSISAAVGLARAKKLKQEPGLVLAVIGDGAFTGGMIYEGINNIEGLDNLVVILNDNKMSISKNTGPMAQYFTRLRTSPQYYKAKSDVKSALDKTPIVGESLVRGIQTIKQSLRRSVYRSTFFEEMGFQYIGPADGHDIPTLCNLLHGAKTIDKPLFIHFETTKGKGFIPAEQNPGAFHGVGSFDYKNITDPDVSPSNSFSSVFGKTLSKLGAGNTKLCAITAAMKYGTGLQYFKKAHKTRFFDVGMAEAHAVTFAAGLARSGLEPVVCIYSTFLQRAYDQIIHDVMLQNLDVLFAIDRAGLVPADGETHQGLYDAAFLSQQHGMPVVSPSNYAELEHWLTKLVNEYTTPRAIRYPRGKESELLAQKPCTGNDFDKLTRATKPVAAMVTYGVQTQQVLEANEWLKKEDVATDVYKMVLINPIPKALIQKLAAYPLVLFAEEGIGQGGIGEHLALQLYKAGFTGRFVHVAAPETGNDHATVEQLKAANGLDAEGLGKRLQAELEGGKR